MKAKTKKIISEVDRYSVQNYSPLPVVITHGRGVWVKDVEGKRYLDCLSAYSAVNQGHCHPKIFKAMVAQARKLTISSRAFHNDQIGPFLKKLCGLAQMEVALPMNSGAEAVETAVKAVRKWGYQKKGVPVDRAEIIVCDGNFHGRTISIVSFSSEAQYREGFGPLTPGFKMIPYGDAEALRRAITPNTVGFLVEPIQGEGGVLIPPTGYLSECRKICEQNRVLLMLDEIQTGLGRTGKLFCYEHEAAAKPDVLILGKALSAGYYPISAVLASHEVFDVIRPGDHGSTFGGNPLAAAIGMASLDVIKNEKLVQRSQKMGAYFVAELKKIRSPHIDQIRGKGLMIGVQVTRASGGARGFCESLAQEGILAKDTHELTIRFTPPLLIDKKTIDWAITKIKKILS